MGVHRHNQAALEAVFFRPDTSEPQKVMQIA